MKIYNVSLMSCNFNLQKQNSTSLLKLFCLFFSKKNAILYFCTLIIQFLLFKIL